MIVVVVVVDSHQDMKNRGNGYEGNPINKNEIDGRRIEVETQIYNLNNISI